jgi:hypothetical protein
MQDDEGCSEGAARAGGGGSGEVPGAGLCNGCAWQRVVTSGRGSRFSMCRRAADDPRFAKYPRLPVVGCAGYEGAAPVGGSPAGGSSPSEPSS